MFGLGVGELAALVVLALFIFGPDKLPKAASQAGRALRQLRGLANNARRDLREGLGPEYADFDLADLNPRRFVRKHLLDDIDDFDDFRDRPRAVTDDPPLAYGERPPFDPEAT